MLASASPRRLELLRQIGLEPAAVVAAEIDETPHRKEKPRDLALRLAREKSLLVGRSHPEDFVLAADTVVAVGRRVLPKAETAETGRTCLELLSGRAHAVLTAVALRAPSGAGASRLVETRVWFKRLTRSEIDAYLDGGEGMGKAGGYAIQGGAGAFVTYLQGSYSAVVGLPLYETANLLRGLGYRA